MLSRANAEITIVGFGGGRKKAEAEEGSGTLWNFRRASDLETVRLFSHAREGGRIILSKVGQ
jgi:hypothetical protein